MPQLPELVGTKGTVGDHPRGLGEQLEIVESDRITPGPIPTGAGSSGGKRSRPGTGWDHPRGSGEQHCESEVITSPSGASPHPRGWSRHRGPRRNLALSPTDRAAVRSYVDVLRALIRGNYDWSRTAGRYSPQAKPLIATTQTGISRTRDAN